MIPPPVPFQALEIGVIIGRIMKEGGAAVAADNDVVEGTGEVHARFASHRGTLQETTHINQYSCLTPFPFFPPQKRFCKPANSHSLAIEVNILAEKT
jgi:hypothetical protein